MKEKVVILGGGVAGMSAAHELCERGFEVEVYEYKSIAGGKARSLRVEHTGVDGRQDLPGEHGFRFFPGFYKHLPDTMKRIPFANNPEGVFNNLVHAKDDAFATYANGLIPILAEFPTDLEDLKLLVQNISDILHGKMGMPLSESEHFFHCFWQILTSCDERKMDEYQKITWWDFSNAENLSPAFQSFIKAFTRTLVAANAQKANARTIGNVGAQLTCDAFLPGAELDRVLNGPTNDRWIDPWLVYLESRGVRYIKDAEVISLQTENGRLSSATIRDHSENASSDYEVSGDHFICAFPIEVMSKLITSDLLALDPQLAQVQALGPYTQWMNGIQFYLLEDVTLVNGHVAYNDTPWALTSISQRQFWPDVDFNRLGDGQVQGILSVDVSDWETPGTNGKAAIDCTPEEVKQEVWTQLKNSLNVGGKVYLTDDMLHSAFIDPDVQFDNPHPSINMEPLLVNEVGTWEMRPDASTAIPNLFLASDYVRTNTDLATMEGANEAARRAVNGILERTGSTAAPCEIFPMYDSLMNLRRPFMHHDKIRYEKGLPWNGHLL